MKIRGESLDRMIDDMRPEEVRKSRKSEAKKMDVHCKVCRRAYGSLAALDQHARDMRDRKEGRHMAAKHR